MKNLRVEHWHQWEKLCCYFMEKIARENFRANIQYQSYGSRGQSQFGVDLVPRHSALPLVGQCKLLERSFTWTMALAEVKKTDKYENPIECYVIFTTAPVHTTVQDVQNRGGHVHTRPDGSNFRVQVIYWENINNIEFIPQEVLREVFPEIFKVVELPAPLSNSPAKNDYLSSLKALKKNIPEWITAANLIWLETWDFGLGYVKKEDFDPFYDLCHEYYRVETAFKGVPQWLHEEKRLSIAECLPAGDNFFAALVEFRQAVVGPSIGQGSTGGGILTVNDKDRDYVSQAVAGWESSARALAATYRSDVLGQPANE
jgi:hypothetical protein